MKQLTLFIFERNRLVREGLIKVLEQYKYLNLLSASGNENLVVEQINKIKPELILIYSNTDGFKEIKLINKIKKINPLVLIILLGNKTNEIVLDIIKKINVEGYIDKDISSNDLVKIILKIIKGEKILKSNSNNKNLKELSKEKVIKKLSKREIEVLALLMKGYSNNEIKEELFISEKTVKSHVYSIMKKLSVKNRTQAVVTAMNTFSNFT